MHFGKKLTVKSTHATRTIVDMHVSHNVPWECKSLFRKVLWNAPSKWRFYTRVPSHRLRTCSIFKENTPLRSIAGFSGAFKQKCVSEFCTYNFGQTMSEEVHMKWWNLKESCAGAHAFFLTWKIIAETGWGAWKAFMGNSLGPLTHTWVVSISIYVCIWRMPKITQRPRKINVPRSRQYLYGYPVQRWEQNTKGRSSI